MLQKLSQGPIMAYYIQKATSLKGTHAQTRHLITEHHLTSRKGDNTKTKLQLCGAFKLRHDRNTAFGRRLGAWDEDPGDLHIHHCSHKQ